MYNNIQSPVIAFHPRMVLRPHFLLAMEFSVFSSMILHSMWFFSVFLVRSPTIASLCDFLFQFCVCALLWFCSCKLCLSGLFGNLIRPMARRAFSPNTCCFAATEREKNKFFVQKKTQIVKIWIAFLCLIFINGIPVLFAFHFSFFVEHRQGNAMRISVQQIFV